MKNPDRDLGALVGAHGIAPSFLQRGAILALLSFIFFLTTLIIFYVSGQLTYFILSTAFLVVYVLTMVSWVLQRRNVVSIYENGLVYRKFSARWDEIASVRSERSSGITIVKTTGDATTIGNSVRDLDAIARTIRSRVGSSG